MRAWKSGVIVLSTACLMVAAFSTAAQGQAADERWLPYLGCWEPTEGAEAGLLCFRPNLGGVEMFNVVDGDVVSTEQIVADGSQRPINADGCEGWESLTFSRDGNRAFTETEFTCDSGGARSGSGIMSFIGPTSWIDVRSLVVSGEPVAWVQRYTLASAEQMEAQGIDDPATVDRTGVRAMRTRVSRDIDIDDVEEAVGFVNAEAVEIWVATQESPFDLDGDALVRLADGGVPESVIDIMVATTYPERFALTPDGVEVDERMVSRRGYRGARRIGFGSYLWDPFYAPIGYRYGAYGYAPYGYYGYGGVYGGYYGYVPTRVIVQPVSGGRMINGVGYRRSSSSGGSASQGSPPAPSRGAVRRSGDSSSGGSAGSSSPSGSSRSGSSGSSSSSGGRRAVPRR